MFYYNYYNIQYCIIKLYCVQNMLLFLLSLPLHSIWVFAIYMSLIKAPHCTSAADIMECKW